MEPPTLELIALAVQALKKNRVPPVTFNEGREAYLMQVSVDLDPPDLAHEGSEKVSYWADHGGPRRVLHFALYYPRLDVAVERV